MTDAKQLNLKTRIACILAAALVLASILLAGCGESSGSGSQQSQEPDVDLTQLSSTMVYSEVYNMMSVPDDYIGKFVRAEGIAVTLQDGGNIYHAVVISDATACCAQGLEYVLNGNVEYPQDGVTATVEGVFETYEENGLKYCHLTGARLVS